MSRLSDLERAERSLRRGLDHLGLSSTDGSVDALLRYTSELLLWNAQTNLTGAPDATSFIEGPLFDALTLLTVLEPSGSLVDVGSGAGLPGIPAAILLPGLRVTLVEPRKQRVAFLRHSVQALSLAIDVVQSKGEALAPLVWSGAVAQAVWAPREWMPRAVRLVESGGAVYVLSTSSSTAEEIPADLLLEESRELERPFDGARRFAARFRRAR